MAGKRALLVGASGLVGGILLHCLLRSPLYTKIIILVRKPLGLVDPKLEERITDFEDLTRCKEYFKVDDVFCCLGTTIKKAGSQESFKKVDVEYPLEMARLAKEMTVKKFLVISAMGADPKSPVFYSRMKGLLEEKLKDSGVKSLHIFRPSLLLGKRKDFRFGESVLAFITPVVSFIFMGSLKKFKPVAAGKVAAAMFSTAQLSVEGIHIYSSNEIDIIS